LVDEGKIILMNAYALAKLPEELQNADEWIQRAVMEPASEFTGAVEKKVKDIRDAKRKGEEARTTGFELIPQFQKKPDLLTEIETLQFGSQIISQLNVTDPLQGYKLGLQFALRIDPVTADIRKKEFEDRQKGLEELRKKRELESLQRKQQKQLEKAAAVEAELEKARQELTHAYNTI